LPKAFLAFLADLAKSLNNKSLNKLSKRLGEMGRQEGALAAAQEATDLYLQVAEARPDAFLAELSSSLYYLGSMLGELGRREDALAAVREAVATLRPQFLRYPRAFAARMARMARNYAERCEELGRQPDAAPMAPVLEVFEGLQEPR
jgi:tetratricopeptide (TPR) repeat protein